MTADVSWQEHAVVAWAWDSRGRWHRIQVWPEGGAVHARYDVRAAVSPRNPGGDVLADVRNQRIRLQPLAEWLRNQIGRTAEPAQLSTADHSSLPPEIQAFAEQMATEDRESVLAALDRVVRRAADAWPEFS